MPEARSGQARDSVARLSYRPATLLRVSEVRKISVSMPAEVIERVKLAAKASGQSVSAWLTEAAVEQLDEQARLAIGRVAAEQLVAEYEAEHGPIPAEIVAEVDAFLAGPGPTRIEPDELRRTG